MQHAVLPSHMTSDVSHPNSAPGGSSLIAGLRTLQGPGIVFRAEPHRFNDWLLALGRSMAFLSPKLERWGVPSCHSVTQYVLKLTGLRTCDGTSIAIHQQCVCVCVWCA